MKKLLTLLLAACALAPGLLPYASAQSIWNVTTGDWNTPGNWSPSGVPDSSTAVIIGTDATNRTASIISANAASDITSIGHLTGNIGTVNVVFGKTWTTGPLDVGVEGNGTLNIQNGGVVSSSDPSAIGSYSGGTGTATVTGAGSQWASSSLLYVGRDGNGTLNIQNGGVVSNTAGYIAEGNGSTGMATVTGAGSQWTMSGPILNDLYVGFNGNGTLNIENGGVVSNAAGYIGYGSGSTSTATVTGGGSQWTNSGDLFIGRSGNGTLTVNGGGKVTASSVFLADTGSGTGTLNLSSGASTGVLETAFISEGTGTGGGTINFSGGTLRATANQADFLQNFETGDVQVQGMSIDTNGYNIGISTALEGTGGINKQGAGTLTLSGTSTYTFTTTVSQGALFVDGSIAASSGVLLAADTTLGGHGIVSTITGAGTVAPGNSPGLLTATSIGPGLGMDFTFEFTEEGSPFDGLAINNNFRNDVLRLTDLIAPFASPLDAGNIVMLDFTGVLAPTAGQVYRGGFYADSGDFLSNVQSATYQTTGLGSGLFVSVSTFQETHDFGGGNVNGYVSQFTVVSVPEPTRALLLVIGLAGTVLRRRRSQTRHHRNGVNDTGEGQPSEPVSVVNT